MVWGFQDVGFIYFGRVFVFIFTLRKGTGSEDFVGFFDFHVSANVLLVL